MGSNLARHGKVCKLVNGNRRVQVDVGRLEDREKLKTALSKPALKRLHKYSCFEYLCIS